MKIFPMERYIFNPGIRFAYITARYQAKSAVTDKLTGHTHTSATAINNSRNAARETPEPITRFSFFDSSTVRISGFTSNSSGSNYKVEGSVEGKRQLPVRCWNEPQLMGSSDNLNCALPPTMGCVFYSFSIPPMSYHDFHGCLSTGCAPSRVTSSGCCGRPATPPRAGGSPPCSPFWHRSDPLWSRRRRHSCV